MTNRELQPADYFQWIAVLRRCMIPLELKGFAALLASYGDPDGTRIRPGQARIAGVTGKAERTARRKVEQLLEMGLLDRVRNGGGPGRLAAEYRLTIPTDLLETVPMLLPDEVTPANNVRDVAADQPVDNPSPDSNSGQTGADPGRSSEAPDEVTPANPEGISGQIGTNSGQREPLTSTDTPPPDLPPTPTKTSPEVSTSRAPATRGPEAIDPRPAVAPAARSPGQGQFWPAPVPNPEFADRIASLRTATRRRDTA